MPATGMDFFLNATNLEHWPGSSQEDLCYFQYIRAHTQGEYAQGIPFSLPISQSDQFGISTFAERLPYLLETVDTEKYDLSICEALLGIE
ncbi:MAG: hypothetical protein JXB38_19190 [Anaerolineales bacterium]|nr:hypothetical protein [Anaerolineales bacterium]